MTDASFNRWQDSANEVLARAFLDEASPIILSERVLSAEKYAELQQIATRLGMSHEQLVFELRLLEQRGVIALGALPPAPAPVADEGIEFLDDVTSEPTVPPADEIIIAAPVEARTPPQRPAPKVTPVELTPPPVVRIVKAASEDPVTAFLEKAVVVLAKHKGLDAQCQLLLMAEASHFGLTPEEAWDAIGTLLQRQQAPASPPQVAPAPVAPATPAPARVEPAPFGAPPATAAQQPAPVAPPVAADPTAAETVPPAEAYREYLREMMGQLTAGIVSEKIEKRFVRVGRKRHSLASVYIQHLLAEVAEQQGVRVLSQEAAHNRPPTTDTGNQDPKLDRFLEQVAPIIAEYRGINARSKLLMSAVATEEGLTDEELQAAIASLQGQTSPTAKADDHREQQLQERQASFDKHLREALQALPNGILTPRIRSQLLEAGEFREGLPRETVDSTIASLATEMKVLSVSEDNASEHLRALITDALSDVSELPPAALQQLYAEAQQWGLRREQVNALVDEEMVRNWQQQRRQGRRTALLLGLSLTTAMTLLIAILWVVMTGNASRRVGPLNPVVDQEPAPTIDTASREDTSWWNSDLQVAVADARVHAEAWRDDLGQLRAAEPSRRQEAYRGLLNHVTGSDVVNGDDWLRLSQLFAICFALEPATANVEWLQANVLQLVPASDATAAASPLAYDQAFAAIDVLSNMVTYSATPAARAEQLTRAMAAHLAVNIDATLPRAEMQNLCSVACLRQAYQAITVLATTQANTAVALHATLATHAAALLSGSALIDLEADFLLAILPELQDGWRQFESLIDRCVAEADPVVVLRLTKFYEQTASWELQAYLGVRLLERAAPNQQIRDVASVVREVNRAFGGKTENLPDPRWSELALRATRVAAPPLADQANLHRVLNQALARAHLNTLAVMISRGSATDGLFRSRVGEEPPRLAASNTPPLRRWPTKAPQGEANALRQLRATLKLVTESRFGKQRTDALENLAELTDEIEYISRPQATILAKYLVRPRDRNSDEHGIILTHIKELGRWQRVQIALSEQLYNLKAPDPQIHEMLEMLAGQQTRHDDVKKWQEGWRIALLENVLDVLTADGNGSNAGKSYDSCRDQLTVLYRQQASLLKIPDEVLNAAKEPAALLRRMIAVLGAELLAQADGDQAEWLRQLDHVLTVDEYVSDNQIEQFVALQRTWLQLVQMYVTRKLPDTAQAADQLASELAAKDRAAADLFVQLRDGEEAILRSWLLMESGGSP